MLGWKGLTFVLHFLLLFLAPLRLVDTHGLAELSLACHVGDKKRDDDDYHYHNHYHYHLYYY